MVRYYLIDSNAWIEYFLGSEKGGLLKKLFEVESNKFFTVECSLAEIKEWCIKNDKDFGSKLEIIKANSNKIKINESDWVKAAVEKIDQRKSEKDFGLIDAVILVKAKESKLVIITGDSHFRKLNDVLFLN